MDKFSITLMNQITGQNHAFEIDSLNYMCTTMLGGTGGHTYIVPALKEICSLLGYSTTGNFTIELLNTICTGGGGTGGHTYEYEAWYEIQQGSLLNLPEWAKNPFFAIPSTGVSLLVGQEVTIYGDTLINVPIVNNLSVTYTCDIGTQSGNNFVVNPVAGNIGNHTLTILFKNKGLTITTETITLKVIPAVAFTDSILMIGDSTLDGDIETIVPSMNGALTGETITFLGTQGTTYKHEGKPGWSYQTFVTDDTSPFRKAGAVDIPAYFTDNSIATPGVVYMRLGVNAMFGASDVSRTEIQKTAAIANEVGYAKTLIDAFLAYNQDLKIVLALPTICSNTVNGWNANYDESVYIQDKYIELMHRFWVALIAQFDDAGYVSRVKFSFEAINLDRDTGYPKTDGVHNNALHLDTIGNQMLGVGLALYINDFERDKGSFKITVDTTKAGSATNTFILPLGNYAYDAYVDWGDGGSEEHIVGTNPGNKTKVYAAPGTYQIKISGTFPVILFNGVGDRLKLMYIDQWGTIAWSNMAASFYGCANMQGRWRDVPVFGSGFNCTAMFSGCSVFNYPINFITSNVVNITAFLQSCSAYNQSEASWNTINVTSFNNLHRTNGSFKQSLATYNLSNATDIADMLTNCNINSVGTANYDATLIAWAAQTVKPNLTFMGGNSKYSAGAAATARGVLTGAPNNWTITDGGI